MEIAGERQESKKTETRKQDGIWIKDKKRRGWGSLEPLHSLGFFCSVLNILHSILYWLLGSYMNGGKSC